ncbi:TRAP transporter small permease [Azospirillum brasilense]|uniref:TRAP transporter small permease n=1 Tax=Azospirillum brasilense TaxID=192 RepID=UPI001EDB180E|nr:TRAP transporter small permease [Azospirillum brasilense]
MPMKILDHLEEILIAFLMAAATTIIFVAVVHRYASGIPVIQDYILHWNLAWAQELCIYMFVWMAKFGAAYGVRTGIHVGVDVLINKLSVPMRSKFIVFGLLAGATFTGVVGTMGSTFVWHMSNTEQVSADLEWPMWIIYLAIPVGSYLMCFRFLQVMVNFLRTGELPHHDHGHVEGLEEDITDPQRAAQDVNWFEMDDNLHPHDIAHHEGRKPGNGPAAGPTAGKGPKENDR